jgi:hypothetical protein
VLLEEDIYEALTASPMTAAGTNVAPGTLPQNANALPRITFSRVGSTPSTGFDGNAGLDFVRIQVDCWASSFVAARSLAAEVRAVLESQPFKALMQTDFTSYEGDTRLHRASADYRCVEKVPRGGPSA